MYRTAIQNRYGQTIARRRWKMKVWSNCPVQGEMV
jgi:hypothetical protein